MGGIAHDDDVCGNVLRHHGAGTDNRVVADSHAGQDDGTCAEPYVAADVNLPVASNLVLAQTGRDGVDARGQRAVGANHRVIADEDVAVIHEAATEVLGQAKRP